MKIPFSVVFTKCDLQVKDKLTKTFNSLNKLFNPYKKRLLPMTEKNIASEIDVSKYIPAFFISSKTGENILLFMKFLSQIKPKEIIHEYISIDNVFNVVGVGKVVTGYCGMEVNLHDKLYLGPSYDGSFTEITVRSIHDNYHNSIKSIKDKFGGFAIKLSKKMHIYKGTILSKTVLPVFETIKARIKIICLNVSISTGYNTTFCIQSASVSAKFVFDEPIIRSDKIWHDISITFLRPIFCQVNDKFVFREKKIIGYGIVL
jgi:GTPase